MSITGKGSLSIRKEDVREQKNLTVGFKKLTFAHKATLGDTGINLGALVVPTEMSGVGFTNPTAAELLAAQLLFYRKNLTLVSSIKGPLMDYLSYDISTASRISFNGFTAEDGEIFIGTIDYNARNGYPLVDAAPLVSTGTLAVSVTDYNVGQMFEVNKYPSQQVGAVSVFRNGLQQFRNTNNSSVTLDGNYYEVNNGSGSGQIIRFNTAPVGDADSILVVSNGLLAYNPDGSALQQIEALAGKIDVMIPTLADLAGVPQTNFQAAPSNVDLKSFGDTVFSQGTRITALEVAVAPAARVYKTANQSISDSAFNKVTWDAATLDNNSMFDNANDRLIINTPGLFDFNVQICWALNGTGYREMVLYKNGVLLESLGSDSGSNDLRVNGHSSPIQCIVGDYFEIFVYQNSGGALNVQGSYGQAYNYFGVRKVGA